ncbi:tyrosine-type recombinase/integrase [Thioclava atlantica]|uniref:Phage integrase n=1 Tax=Thioclava atlantica TaxID=1317124 RepID=A0A085TU00_9RHOB|nr:site-specific integrase [Thioclava atlantica]KFE34197.1 phage integrase [Thioclava atlantica]
MNGKLTATFVKNIKQPGSYSDKLGHGLRLRVKPDGRKNWIQRITINGKLREAGLGSPPVVTLAMAREQAIANKRMAYVGKDPIEERRQRIEALTFGQAVERYIAHKLAEFRSEKHRKQWRSTLDRYAVPVIGEKSVEDLGLQDMLDVLTPIWSTKTETASRLRQRMEAVLSWAAVSGYRIEANPARWKGNLSEVLPKPSKVAKKKHHPAVALADAPAFWARLRKMDGMSARALEFLCLTAARSGEVRGMTWAELDLDKRLWIIPAERMKAAREHRVTLSDAAIDVLRALPRLEGSDVAFFAPRGGALSDMSISAVMRRMDESAQKSNAKRFLDPQSGDTAVPHGLRSTFRDWAAENGHDHVLAELALAHHVGSTVERAYRRSDMVERRRELMAQWAEFLGA